MALDTTELTNHRDEILRDEFFGMIWESALAKNGFVLTAKHINPALVEFLRRYEFLVALWNDANGVCSTVVRHKPTDSGYLLGNTIVVKDRETAMALYEACRADDNCANVSSFSMVSRDISKLSI